MRNHRARALHDIARRTVIAFEFYDSHGSKVAVEVADNLDVRATPAINTLVVITHHRHVLVFVYQQLQQFVLHVVRILIFVNDHVPESFGKLFGKTRHLLEHEDRIEQEVVKVHRVRFA